MSTSFRFSSAVSLVALASMIAGCAGHQDRVATNAAKADNELGLATRAMVALNSNDIPNAIGFAERAAERTPDDVAVRTLLGNTYFAGGRFWSAEQAYKDSLALNSSQPQVVLKLALVEIALGKTDEALSYLDAGRSVMDPADYGLALALAGHNPEALNVLQYAARARGADGRVRQNLALVYALSGDWTNARTVAAQDVPADQLEARIQQWMQLAKPGKASDRVASLVGVTPAAQDQGQPVRLALVKTDTRLAQAAPAAKPAPAPMTETTPAPVPVQFAPAPVEVAQSEPQPGPLPQFAAIAAPPAPPPADPHRVAAARAPVPAKAEAPAPLTMALIAAAAPEAPSAYAAFMPKRAAAPVAKPVKARVVASAARPAFRNSGPVVQLGAYRSPQYVSAAWNHLTGRYPALRAYLPMRAKFVSPKGTFYRLSITGFANQRDAQARCQVLKNRGGNCFVRNFAGDTPVQYASR